MNGISVTGVTTDMLSNSPPTKDFMINSNEIQWGVEGDLSETVGIQWERERDGQDNGKRAPKINLYVKHLSKNKRRKIKWKCAQKEKKFY